MHQPGPLPTRWLSAYLICLALLGTLSILLGMAIMIAPALGERSEAVLWLVLGAIYLTVAVGLNDRRLWAWRFNYWGLLLVQPIALTGFLGFWETARFKLLTRSPIGVAVLLGVWAAANMRYFRRRRYLFEDHPPSPSAGGPLG
jgi:hypothetical protein